MWRTTSQAVGSESEIHSRKFSKVSLDVFVLIVASEREFLCAGPFKEFPLLVNIRTRISFPLRYLYDSHTT